MLIQGSAVSKRTDFLVEKYAELLNSGVEACEILVLTQNSYKKKIFSEKIKPLFTINHFENPQIHTFYGLAYNSISNCWQKIENTINIGKPLITPNLIGLEISHYFYKQAVRETGFKDYNSKINLVHQLFRRNSLIVNNNLSDDEVFSRSKMLKESFSDDAKTAIGIFKKKTVERRAFDYIRQVNIFNWIYQKTDYFKDIKYLIVDDADEITTAEFDFIKYLKPQLKEAFVGYDKNGSSRLGFLNTDIKIVEKIEKLFAEESVKKLDSCGFEMPTVAQQSFARRLEMIEAALSKINDLINSGVNPDEICVVTPIIDSALKFSISEAFDNKGIKYQYFSGSSKLAQTSIVKNALSLLNLSLDVEEDIFKVRAVLSDMMKIPIKYCIQLVQNYKENKKLSPVDLNNDEYNSRLKSLTETIAEISDDKLALSDKILIIYNKLLKFDKDCTSELEDFNFFIKQVRDFEAVFPDFLLNCEAQKEILTQLENSIISENPSYSPEIEKDTLIIATAQKVIDFSLNKKYQFWLDTSSGEWVKDDLGTLYNSWVFQNSWDKDSFTFEDNLELSETKNLRMLRKLSILAGEKTHAYSSLFDIQGAENFGGLEKYLTVKSETDEEIDFKFVPRADQKPVLEYKGGHLAISAVPGAGKTTILLALVLKLIKNKVSPENIFVLTYMDSAARNFKERIKTACPSLEKMPNISTIHGLALRILKENSNFVKVGLDEDFEVCDDSEKQKILREVMYHLQFEPDDFDKYEKGISALKLSDVSTLPFVKDNELKKFLKLYNTYNTRLKDKNTIDYDDMLSLAVKVLEQNPDTADYYQNLCRYVIEDEAQDSSVIQQKLLNLLSAKHKNLIRCGDVNQAITTTFTNADVEGFKAFLNSGANVSMNRSQRCCKDVYNLANMLVDFSKTEKELENAFYDMKMQEVEGRNPVCLNGVKVKTFEDYNEERSYLLQEIRNVFSSEPEASVAVLVRNNFLIEEYGAFLSSFGYDVITRGDRLSEQPIFALVFSILKFCAFPWQNEKVVESAIVLKNQKLIKLDETDISYLENLKTPFIMLNQDELQSEALVNLWWDLNYWLEKSSLNTDEIGIKIGNYYYFSDIEKSNIYMIALLLKRLSSQYKTRESLLERLEELSKRPVMNQLKFFTEEEKNDKKAAKSGTIQIMTYHKSKGDEFDYVFIPNLTEKNLGLDLSKIKISSKERFLEAVKGLNLKYDKKDEQSLKIFQAEENLRLFYVAVTRAKKRVYVSCAGKYKQYSRVRDFESSILFEKLLKEFTGAKNGK